MKCIEFYKPNVKTVRVTDSEAHLAVSTGKARFIPKRVWKQFKSVASAATPPTA
jgi:hypothetical protein